VASRRPPKKSQAAETVRWWQISRIAKKGLPLGRVEAPTAEAAVKVAIEQYSIGPEHQDRLIATPA
jgi:hypothetical protein